MAQRKVVIIGAGYSGLAAAYELVRAGVEVEIFEADSEVGGLAGTFELSPGVRIEKFYHHWFTSDRAVLGLIEELGLSANLKYLSTNTGLYFANSVFRLASPLDLLRFHAIPFVDRIRTGLMALYARRINDWKSLEGQSAEEWLIRIGGRRSYHAIWKPLLAGKFGVEAPNISAVWFWNKLKLRGSSRDPQGKESLVYFNGGFGALTSALRERLVALGVKINLNCAAQNICIESGKCTAIQTAAGISPADAVLATVPLPDFLSLAPELPAQFVESAKRVRFLGNVCLVLRLRRSLSSTYWLNVADPSFPFVGVIEHTNFDDKANYGGEHVAYLSKYLPVSEEMFNYSEQKMFEYAIPFVKRIFPEFSTEWVIGYRVWKAKYSQPVIVKHYSTLIPPIQTPIRNLWLSTMAQIYPEDRGTNYAVRHGRYVASQLLKTI